MTTIGTTCRALTLSFLLSWCCAILYLPSSTFSWIISYRSFCHPRLKKMVGWLWWLSRWSGWRSRSWCFQWAWSMYLFLSYKSMQLSNMMTIAIQLLIPHISIHWCHSFKTKAAAKSRLKMVVKMPRQRRPSLIWKLRVRMRWRSWISIRTISLSQCFATQDLTAATSRLTKDTDRSSFLIISCSSFFNCVWSAHSDSRSSRMTQTPST